MQVGSGPEPDIDISRVALTVFHGRVVKVYIYFSRKHLRV